MVWAAGQDVSNPLHTPALMILADALRDVTGLCFPGLERIAVIGETIAKFAARLIDALPAFGFSWIHRRVGETTGP